MKAAEQLGAICAITRNMSGNDSFFDDSLFRIPKYNHREVKVGCCMCGSTNKTLLNRDNKRICKDCFSKT